jgi:amino-acid N-acetyltransferase
MEEVATSTAIALQADKLVFMTEMPGIREDLSDADSAIDTELSLAEAQRLLAKLPAPLCHGHSLLSAALRQGL